MIILFGVLVGLLLGITGGGGSLLAIPFLVYGLHVPMHQAVGVSLAVVGITALSGAWAYFRRGLVDVRGGGLFAAGGLIGAPLGVAVGQRCSETFLLVGFALLMLIVAALMWKQANRMSAATATLQSGKELTPAESPACQLNPAGRLTLTAPCAAVLAAAGIVTGVLSGIFGIGGGFIIVPILLKMTKLTIHQAVATSLFIITLIGASGAVAFVQQGLLPPPGLVLWFVSGSLGGLFVGIRLSRKLAGPLLQRLFAVIVIGIGISMIALRWYGA